MSDSRLSRRLHDPLTTRDMVPGMREPEADLRLSIEASTGLAKWLRGPLSPFARGSSPLRSKASVPRMLAFLATRLRLEARVLSVRDLVDVEPGAVRARALGRVRCQRVPLDEYDQFSGHRLRAPCRGDAVPVETAAGTRVRSPAHRAPL